MSYKTGYKRPPLKGQFKKGSSGNPKGRPTGSKNLSTQLDDELAKKIVITENGKKKTITRQEAILKRLINASIQGDWKALRLLVELKRMFGEVAPPEIRYESSPETRRRVAEAVEVAQRIMTEAGIPRVLSNDTIAQRAGR